MRSWVRIWWVAWAMMIALVACAPAATADVFAVAQTASSSPSRTDLDVGLVDVNTGVFQSLPAGVNTTTASEFHPSITSDGRFLVFERVDHAAGTDRIIMADLTTGQTADLFTAFETGLMHPTSPYISRDGGIVLTGGPVSSPTHTDVSKFPAGPYPHFGSTQVTGARLDLIVDPADDDSAFASLNAWRTNTTPGTPPGTIGRINMHDVGGHGTLPASTFVHDAHPAIGSFGATMLWDRHSVSSAGAIGPGDIHFCADTTDIGVPASAAAGNCGVLPPIVNSPLNETRPALTADGRYVGFIRSEDNGHERVFVFDTQTQTMLNASGVDLGPVRTPDSGNLGLYEKPVFTLATIINVNTISFSLLQPASVGILVQRVAGHHSLLGRRVPTLRPVGRVPFGTFHRGHGHAKWDLRVNGRRLPPGTYQVTVRALTKSGRVRDMGTPRIIRIRDRR
jgi:WD40-like Beta Propeller Repeat